MNGIDPTLLAVATGVVGFFLAEWRRGRDSHTNSIRVDADLLARLQAVEQWTRDHNTIHGCVRELAATVKSMAGTMDRLTARLDAFMAAHPLELRRPTSPYETPPMRDWVRDK